MAEPEGIPLRAVQDGGEGVELQDENPVRPQVANPLAECPQLVGLVHDAEAAVDDDISGFAGTHGTESLLGEQVEPRPAVRAGELCDGPTAREHAVPGEGGYGVAPLAEQRGGFVADRLLGNVRVIS
ncbi:hypothetical protein [Pseudonocardia nigra]|uniref:hypothetical protein n=1 Tax=Pseudonocardia nigra TaxID=1921578 RepID=UPI001C5CDA70|nr:hypothetical protein [Pseudonocardia nigra]